MQGIAHGIEVAGVARQVEDHPRLAGDVSGQGRIAHVADADVDTVFVAGQVDLKAAMVGSQGIDHRDPGAEIGQPPRQVGADEAETAGDQHPLALQARAGARDIGDAQGWRRLKRTTARREWSML